MTDLTDGRLLAIDYGTKRIGVALSDPLCIFPSVIKTFSNDEELFSQLSILILQNSVREIILGNPDFQHNQTSDLAKEIIKFKSKLEHLFNISVQLWNEHSTSKVAETRIRESVTKKSKRRNKSLLDAHSAAVILEDYIRSKK